MATPEQINKLISDLRIRRGIVKTQLTKMKSYVETKVESANMFELETKLGMLEGYLVHFDSLQSNLELNDKEEITSIEREVFEDTYFCLKSKLLCSINKMKPRVSIGNPDSTLFNSQCQSASNLPKLKLPTFSGGLTDWLDFWGTFTSLVHDNEKIKDVDKLQHLRNCLSGNASKVLQSLEILPENYPKAIERLKSRYFNKRFIFQAHVNEIFQLQTIENSSIENLRHIADSINAHMRSLLTITSKEQIADGLLVYLLASKLDTSTQTLWEEEVNQNTSKSTTDTEEHIVGLPTWLEFSNFIEKRCQTLELIEACHRQTVNQFQIVKQSNKKYNSKQSSFASTVEAAKSCVFCGKNQHSPFHCQSFTVLEPKARYQEVKRLNLCLNCLKPGHSVKSCISKNCHHCDKRHHSLLHLNLTSATSSSSSSSLHQAILSNSSPTKCISTTSTSIANPLIQSDQINRQHNSNTMNPSVLTTLSHQQAEVLLSTAIIEVKNSAGSYIPCRALLDSGSQLNFISERLVQMLGLRKTKLNCSFNGINNISTTATSMVTLCAKSRHTEWSTIMDAIVITNITSFQPQNCYSPCLFNIPDNIELADPTFNIPQRVDILIGASHFFALLCVGQIKLGSDQLILQKTLLGWIISGIVSKSPNICCSMSATSISNNQDHCIDSIEEIMQSFWQIEHYKAALSKFSVEDQACEDHYVQTHTRNNCGRYVVKLPFKRSPAILGTSLEVAQKRFFNLEKKFDKNRSLQRDYSAFLHEYLAMQHMEEVPETMVKLIQHKYFLPHHPVINENSSSTKLRVVFDGSSKSSTGFSINDCLLVGPTIQNDIFTILFRFRLHRYVLTADIVKMYRQFNVAADDSNFQFILWRNSTCEDVKFYRLRTVTYGTASALFLAIRSLVQLAIDEQHKHPVASKIVQRDFYVDNLMTGADTIEELVQIKSEVSLLLQKGCLPLRKWCSNSEKVIANVAQEDREKYMEIDCNAVVKTLGMIWNPKSDAFLYSHLDNSKTDRVTKRNVLSQIGKFFDPLGLISPLVLSAKIFLQQLWKFKLHWDESLPQQLSTYWNSFVNDLHFLREVVIKRYVTESQAVSTEIHAFCDASEKPYGACIYLRTIGVNGKVMVSLLCAKSRVAPLRIISLPRLELCGALLLAELLHRVTAIFEGKELKVCCWTDSTIVLSWLSSESYLFKSFVANRTTKIQELTSDCKWNHVPTDQNPADIVSRGATAKELSSSSLWFSGPAFLHLSENSWPASYINPIQDLPEMKSQLFSCLASSNKIDLIAINKFVNSYFRILLVFAIVRRFIQHKIERNSGPISTIELDLALKSIVRNLQMVYFAKDYSKLQADQQIPRDSRLANLNPFLDTDGIIRVGGRIKYSKHNYDAKHQMVLPQKHPFVYALISHHHIKYHHCACQTLLTSVDYHWNLEITNIKTLKSRIFKAAGLLRTWHTI